MSKAFKKNIMDNQPIDEDELDLRPDFLCGLDEAFTLLREKGIICKMAFSCCQVCGLEEIQDEMSPKSLGATFFTYQDADCLFDVEPFLYLNYCPGTLAIQDVGYMVKSVLQSCGLLVHWDGDIDKRIRVEPRSM